MGAKTSPIPAKTSWPITILGGALLLSIIFAVYWPVMRGGFAFDDESLIVHGRLIQDSNGLYRIWFTSESADYWPITYTAWWIQWHLWGPNAAGFHAVNVALHAIDAILIWIVLRRLTLPGAWLAALAFAIHPINVVTAAWISEQKNTLSMLFYALSILSYLKFDQHEHRKWYVLSLIAFALALLSKTSVVMEPVVLLGLAWWNRGRITSSDMRRAAPFFALALAGAYLTIALQTPLMLVENPAATIGFPSQLALAGWALWFYLYQTLLPLKVMVIYPNWKVDPTWWISYLPAAAWVGLFGLFWSKRKSWGRPCLFGFGYFTATIFPVLGFFHQSWHAYSRVADQWMYVPMLGLLALFTAAAATAWRRQRPPARYLAALAAAAVFLFLALSTWKLNRLFADQALLWRDNIEKNPDAWAAYNNLGVTLAERGQVDEAIPILREAIRRKADYADAYGNLGNELVVKKQFDEAMMDYRRAIMLNPHLGETQKYLAELYLREGDKREAIEHWKAALADHPDEVDVLNNLAWVLATADPSYGGDPSQAVPLAQHACDLTQNRQATYLDTLSVAQAASGQFTAAAATAQKAVQLAQAAGDDDLAKKIQARLALYRAGKPYTPPK
ncbi:MAG: tetratricopeptide repeat protein [Tepidisphaeraceae bacterium]|jgi:tetratricopeptide (TPR) repeat protein